MTRLQRLVLDAIEAHGPDATVVQNIYPYVNARRWMFSYGSLYPALIALEDAGLVTSRWQEGAPPRRRLYSAAVIFTPDEIRKAWGHIS